MADMAPDVAARPDGTAPRRVPRLLGPGDLLVSGETGGEPTIEADRLNISYRVELPGFNNSYTKAALCIVERDKDFRYDGLHLTVEAARRFAIDLTVAAFGPDGHPEQLRDPGIVIVDDCTATAWSWYSLSRRGAVTVAAVITSALARAGV